MGRVRPKSTGKDNEALLAHTMSPPSPSIWGVNDDLALYPSTMPSSFETGPSVTSPTRTPSPSNSALPEKFRFQPQHEPRKGPSTEDMIGTAALQFVPAYSESTSSQNQFVNGSPARKATPSSVSSPTKRLKPKEQPLLNSQRENSSSLVEPSWDAIIEADDSSLRSKSSRGSWRSSRKSKRDKSLDSLSSAEEKKSSPSGVRGGGLRRRQRGRNTVSNKGPPKVIPSDNATSVQIGVPTTDDASEVSAASRRGPRIARLASMFTARTSVSKPDSPSKVGSGTTKAAAMKQVKDDAVTGKVPSSPARSQVSSSSSTGCVGWPGTQDKKGKVVAMESSYDDSSVGAAAFRDSTGVGSMVRNWMKDDDVETGGSDVPDPECDTKSAADFHLEAVLKEAKMLSPAVSKALQQPLRNNDKVKMTGAALSRLNTHHSRSGTTRSQTGASSVAGTSASTAISIQNLFPEDPPSRPVGKTLKENDPWDVDSSSQPPSSPGTSVSKDSSAFFHMGNDVALSTKFPVMDPQYGVRTNVRGAASIIRRKQNGPQPPTERALQVQNHFAPPPRAFAAGGRGFRGYLDKREDVPNLMDDEIDDSDSIASSRATSMALDPPSQSVPSTNRLAAHVARTRPAMSAKELDEESDVFDGISKYDTVPISTEEFQKSRGFRPKNGSAKPHPVAPSPSATGEEDDGINVVMLPGGLRVIQTTQHDFEMRKRASDFDENLSSSDIDQYGFAKTPGLQEMMTKGRSPVDSAKYVPHHDSMPPLVRVIHDKRKPRGLNPPAPKFGEPTYVSMYEESSRTRQPLSMGGVFDATLSDSGSGDGFSDRMESQSVSHVTHQGDLTKYRVAPGLSKRLVRAYRDVSRRADTDTMTVEEFQMFEDAKKGFALSEMRSRIMEKDLERGLERQGGSVPVDDIVLTPFYQASHRVRDAVIVSKAWRDGASPSDVVTATKMTRRAERTCYVKRPVQKRSTPNWSGTSDQLSIANEFSYSGHASTYIWEEVAWLDDTDFMQMRCPSLGPRNMRGFEMFTIGDCQSILLKLTNERCMQLRRELNDATARQIDAEEMMKEEGDYGEDMMTESEMVYLAAMEDVKTISKNLVTAEKSFNLVRDRIETLMARYEAILVKMENESIATASVITYESSHYSDGYDSEGSYTDDDDSREREMFQRRAQRAELRAELAAREALLAKQETKKIKDEKQREIEALQLKLAELQSESSYAISERQHSLVLAKAIAQNHGAEHRESHHGQSSTNGKTDRINYVKQKFRDRMAERLKLAPDEHPGHSQSTVPQKPSSTYRPNPRPTIRAQHPRSQRRVLVGEEMFQHLDFYERSLKAVDPVL